ncbi:MAG: helix-turn-helix transcriptional regulator [Thermomicrobiales bacterium]
MMETGWNQRFFASTRGRIVALLRRAVRTVDELASQMELTDNAVRAHLATLERDGLVRQEGVRRGAGKPAYAYHLTPEGEGLFPKAYGAILRELLDVLGARLNQDDLEAALREVGRRLAAQQAADGDALPDRVQVAAAVLNELGGLAECEATDGLFVIQGYRCPLAAVVPEHPTACVLASALVSELVGQPVRECCQRGAQPACRFEIPRAAASPAPAAQ